MLYEAPPPRYRREGSPPKRDPLEEFRIEQRDFVQSLERGLAILRAFGPGRTNLSLSEVARLTGLTRAAARRFLLTFTHLGYVATDRKMFWLTPRVLELGRHYLSAQPWWEIAQPVVEEAARRMGESCSLCILDGADIIYVCRVAISRLISINLSIGSRLPASPTALGRVLLAQLPPERLEALLAKTSFEQHTPHTLTEAGKLIAAIEKARGDGFSVVDQELEIGLVGVAVPVRDTDVLSALGVSVNSARMSATEAQERYLPVLQESAERISAGLTRAGLSRNPR